MCQVLFCIAFLGDDLRSMNYPAEEASITVYKDRSHILCRTQLLRPEVFQHDDYTAALSKVLSAFLVLDMKYS